VNGVQTAAIPVIFWTRAVKKRDARKENNGKRTSWKKIFFQRKRMKWKIPSSSTGFTH